MVDQKLSSVIVSLQSDLVFYSQINYHLNVQQHQLGRLWAPLWEKKGTTYQFTFKSVFNISIIIKIYYDIKSQWGRVVNQGKMQPDEELKSKQSIVVERNYKNQQVFKYTLSREEINIFNVYYMGGGNNCTLGRNA